MRTINITLATLLAIILGVAIIVATAHADATAPRQRLARSLTPTQVARVVTNAPALAKVTVPQMFFVRPWTNGVTYAVADPVTYNGAFYLCVQAHHSQSDWMPPIVPALWRQIRAAGESAATIPAWVQPLGAHDAYTKGAKVLYNGKTWESTINANVWAPGVYGWQEVSK